MPGAAIAVAGVGTAAVTGTWRDLRSTSFSMPAESEVEVCTVLDRVQELAADLEEPAVQFRLAANGEKGGAEAVHEGGFSVLAAQGELGSSFQLRA